MVDIPLFIGFHTSQVVQDFFHQQYFTRPFDSEKLIRQLKKTREQNHTVRDTSTKYWLGNGNPYFVAY